jgi:hypothetical protein
MSSGTRTSRYSGLLVGVSIRSGRIGAIALETGLGDRFKAGFFADVFAVFFVLVFLAFFCIFNGVARSLA